MRWLNKSQPPCSLYCTYCGTRGRFPHKKSILHDEETLSLYECTTCRSLVYDLADVDAPIVSQYDVIGVEAMRHARYVFETGFSSHHVAMCALSALPSAREAELREHVFIDIGAGLGMASYFVKALFGMQTVTVEPSFTGKISHEVLGLDVHRVYFEDLPEDLFAVLLEKPCCLHLNSVIEHLVDPSQVLRDMVGRVNVTTLAAIVPDGNALDFEAPFINALPFLAPRDHRHLPTKLGMEMMFRRLGFAHVHVHQADGLLTAVGSRSRVAFPSERETNLAANLLLENLLRHPNPLVAGGGASRLLPVAVFGGNAPLMATLRKLFPFEQETDSLLAKIAERAWDDLPFHLGQSCYWLANDAMSGGRFASAISLLKVSIAFADLIVADYPPLALAALEFKWAAVQLDAHINRHLEHFDDAERSLRIVLDSASDPVSGARTEHRAAAKAGLEAIRAQRKALAPVVRDHAA